MKTIKIGFVPTRRSIFSAPDALKYKKLTEERLQELGIAFVDIDDLNDEGLLYDVKDVSKVAEKFRREEISGVFVPHCNFGTEYAVAQLARTLNKPVLLWGPRDESPDENGIRLRDSQCGLFATGKALRRANIPFTYLTNCRLNDPEFERGIKTFISVCNVVKTFKSIKILQISTRPFEFLSTMCNEGELLERFNIQLAPIPMTELRCAVEVSKADAQISETVDFIKKAMDVQVDDATLMNIAAIKMAMRTLAEKYECNAIALQCWNALQDELQIMPCCANSLLTDEGLPVVCETDIHGAISSLLTQAAGMNKWPVFFADWTVRHPANENGELLQHCGPWPLSLSRNKPVLGYPLAFNYPGAVEAECKHGKITLCRFDGDNGEYSLLLGTANGIDGPFTKGTYLWIEVKNWKRLEAKIVEGPYIHHCVGIHSDVVPILYEACKYIGVKPDLYDENEDEIKAYLRGE